MSSNSIQQPYDIIIHPTGGGGRCKPVSNGLYYVGEINKDPKQNPKQDIVYVDEAGTVVSISSPIQLNASGAFVASKHDGTIISPFLTESAGYSVLIEDSNGNEIYKSSKFGSDDDISALVSNNNVIPNPFLEISGSVANPPDETPRNYNEGDELFKGHFAHTSLTDVKFVDGELSGIGQIRVDIHKDSKIGDITTLFTQSRASSNGTPTQAGTSLEIDDDKLRVIYDVDGTFSVKLEQGGTATKHQYERSNSLQFAPYDKHRIYTTGETCTTIDNLTKEVKVWQWYSNVEFIAGKDPLDQANRQEGWTIENRPFYWTPYKKARAGSPIFPWMSMAFPEGTLNVLGNSVPKAVFWRLAEALPEFVNDDTGMIDFPDTGGEFFRVLDQGRGVDTDREFAKAQGFAVEEFYGAIYEKRSATKQLYDGFAGSGMSGSGGIRFGAGENVFTVKPTKMDGSELIEQANETRSRNLAFPIIIEV